MSVEQPYIDLYSEHCATICKHAAPALDVHRDEAMELFEQLGLPTTANERYKRTDVSKAFAPDYGMNINRINLPINPYESFKCDVPSLHTTLYFLVNDMFYPVEQQPENALPQGVLAGSLRDIALSHPQLVAKYYNTLAKGDKETATTALNTAFAQDGFLLYVPKGVVLEKPLQLVNILYGEVAMLANRRIVVIVEEQAQAKLLVCDHTLGKANYLANQVVELFVGENASLHYYDLEENDTDTTRICTNYLSMAANANVVVNGITLNNGTTRNDYQVVFAGEGAHVDLCGMAIADGCQTVDNYVNVDHAVPYCSSNELFKYILNDKANGSFCGRILVRPDAQKTAAYQSNKNLCLTPEARMYTKPQLEIYADDVKCSHGASVGQLDAQALFYMQTRGISKVEARLLLMYAFASDVLDFIAVDSLKERLTFLVERRLRGDSSKCGGCARCN